jgi:protein-S-isoprenylcysteine O-methyltransferase Ste14
MKDNRKDNPGVIAPPPLIYTGAFLLSLFLHGRFPLPLVPSRTKTLLGATLIGSACIIVSVCFLKMRKAGTNIEPTQPTTALVTGGPYRFTRNPIYLALTLFYTGIATLFNTLWAILLLPVVLLIMNRGVIDREETYLTKKFGEQYLAYKEKVRRWL